MDKITFLKEAFKTIKTSGAILPSSRYLVKELISPINFDEARVIVEFGPGNGIVTRSILEHLHPDATLVAFEINPAFYQSLEKLEHPQLQLVNDSAESLLEVMKKNQWQQVDYIVSCLPLTNIPKPITDVILDRSYEALRSGGKFIQYQYTTAYYKKLKRVFGKVDLAFEPINLPSIDRSCINVLESCFSYI